MFLLEYMAAPHCWKYCSSYTADVETLNPSRVVLIWHNPRKRSLFRSTGYHWACKVLRMLIILDFYSGGIRSFLSILKLCRRAHCIFTLHDMTNALHFQNSYYLTQPAQEIVLWPLQTRYEISLIRIHHRRNRRSQIVSWIAYYSARLNLGLQPNTYKPSYYVWLCNK